MSTVARTPSFGVKTSQQHVTYDEVLRVWQEADASPEFEHAWLWDHFVPLRGDVTGTTLEAWTLLAALAARTTRLRLGVIVTSNRIRPPAVLAKMAVTVDQISNGRLIFGIGAGGSAVSDPAGLALVHRELDAYGLDVVSTADAVGSLGEAVTIISRLWTEAQPFDFNGRYYQLTGAIGEPKPTQRPGPPILIAAAGERGLRITAEHADLWVWPGDLEGFRTTTARLDAACEAVGRDPSEVGRLVQILVRSGDPGALARLVDDLARFVEAGATDLVLAPVPPYPGSAIHWLTAEVVHPLKARLGVQFTGQRGRGE
jgi:alkanesulfonate monooxygenase SsuD/methylene tetrahydromethanopterin reductase-like flavin-dependent oxidoreductase (luciferase family)